MQSDAFFHVMNVSLYNIIKVNIKTDHIASKIKQSFSFRNWIVNLGELVALGIVVALASATFSTYESFLQNINTFKINLREASFLTSITLN